jgi:hypothetical protein
LRVYRDSAFAGATGTGGDEMDDRRPTALRARPRRGAPRPRARVLRDPVVGRVVVAMRASGDELDPSAQQCASPACCLAGMATGGALLGAERQPWLAGRRDLGQAGLACRRDQRWLELVPGSRLTVWPCPSPSRIFDRCAAPSASLTASLRHGIGRWRGRQEPASRSAAQPSSTSDLGTNLGPHTPNEGEQSTRN